MAITIDSDKLHRKLGGKYGGVTKSGDHYRFFWEIEGREFGGAKISRGSKSSDLPDFVAANIARKLGVTRSELKQMEGCSFSKEELLRRLLLRQGSD